MQIVSLQLLRTPKKVNKCGHDIVRAISQTVVVLVFSKHFKSLVVMILFSRTYFNLDDILAVLHWISCIIESS